MTPPRNSPFRGILYAVLPSVAAWALIGLAIVHVVKP